MLVFRHARHRISIDLALGHSVPSLSTASKMRCLHRQLEYYQRGKVTSKRGKFILWRSSVWAFSDPCILGERHERSEVPNRQMLLAGSAGWQSRSFKYSPRTKLSADGRSKPLIRSRLPFFEFQNVS